MSDPNLNTNISKSKSPPHKVNFDQDANFISSTKSENQRELINISEEKSIAESNLKKLTENDGRWEYLYRLNQLKMIKNHYIKELVKKDKIQNELSECTFSPKLNKKILNGDKFSDISRCLSPISRESNSSALSGKYNSLHSYKRANSKNAYNRKGIYEKEQNIDLINCKVLERQKIVDDTKIQKLEILKAIEEEKQFKECLFKPKINSDDYLNKIDIVNKAVDLVVDPISYEQYINRITKFREEKKKIEKENKKILNIKDYNIADREVPRILNQIKSPKNKIQPNIKFYNNSDTINIKSLDKPLESHKFKRNKKNLYSHRLNANQKNNGSLLKTDSNLEDSRENKMINIRGPILYKDAINYIHTQLHYIDLEQDLDDK